MNKVILRGYLTKDIEVKENNKIKLGKFTLAVSRPYKNQNGEYESDFLNCVVFNPGEYIQNNLLKGVRVLVEGRIQTKQYEKDGKNHYSTDIIVERVEILSKPQNTSQIANKPPINPYQDFSEKVESDIGQQIQIEDSDLPF